MQKLPIVIVPIVTSITFNMYVYKHRLAIRDKKNWQKWHHSPLYDTIDQVFVTYKDWLARHPGAIVSFMQEKVFVADQSKGAQS